jgi:hypothetical protein
MEITADIFKGIKTNKLQICFWNKDVSQPQSGSQSCDRELQRQRCKFYNATGSLARFENKNIIFYF